MKPRELNERASVSAVLFPKTRNFALNHSDGQLGPTDTGHEQTPTSRKFFRKNMGNGFDAEGEGFTSACKQR
jgi:hypothetical protein